MHQANQLLRLPAVMAATGLSRSTIYLRLSRDEFPKPVPLGARGRAIGFLRGEVEAWIAARIAQRDQAQQVAGRTA